MTRSKRQLTYVHNPFLNPVNIGPHLYSVLPLWDLVNILLPFGSEFAVVSLQGWQARKRSVEDRLNENRWGRAILTGWRMKNPTE